MKTLRKNISLSTALQEYADKMSAITTGKNAIGYIKNCSHKIRHSEPFSEQNETDDMKSNECLWIITRKKNHDGLLQLSFTLKISTIMDVYITQSNISDRDFISKVASRPVYSQNSSIIDACFGSKYNSAFSGSLYYKILQICHFLKGLYLF